MYAHIRNISVWSILIICFFMVSKYTDIHPAYALGIGYITGYATGLWNGSN